MKYFEVVVLPPVKLALQSVQVPAWVGELMGTLIRKSVPEDANSLGIGNIVCGTNGNTKNLPPIAYESNGEGTLIQLSGSTQDYYKLQLFANPMGLRYRYFRSSWGNWSTGG